MTVEDIRLNLENNRFDAIILDLGGVLINLDYALTITRFKSLGMDDFHAVYSQMTQTDLFDRFETGQISQQTFINALLRQLPAGTGAHQVVDAWNAMILDVPKQSIDLLNELSRTFPLFLLSNTNELHMPVVYAEWKKVSPHSISAYFQKVYLSYEMGLRKPHVEIFEKVCLDQNLQPNRTLFIDDSIQHIQGARQLGLKAFHLKDIRQLPTLFS
jgi:FMN phosphatase YigB (HAD superfamily)